MFGLPSGKILLRAREIQVVKPQESVVQRRVGVRIRYNRGTSPRLQSQDHAQGRHRTEDHFAKLREIWHHMNPSCFIIVGFPDNATLLSFTPCFDATIPGSVCHIPVICQGGGPSFPQWILMRLYASGQKLHERFYTPCGVTRNPTPQDLKHKTGPALL